MLKVPTETPAAEAVAHNANCIGRYAVSRRQGRPNAVITTIRRFCSPSNDWAGAATTGGQGTNGAENNRTNLVQARCCASRDEFRKKQHNDNRLDQITPVDGSEDANEGDNHHNHSGQGGLKPQRT